MSSTSTSTEIELQSVPVAYQPAILATAKDANVPLAINRPVGSTEAVRHDADRNEVSGHADVEQEQNLPEIGKGKTLVVIASVTFITGISSLLSGVVTVALPTIARDLGLSDNLILW